MTTGNDDFITTWMAAYAQKQSQSWVGAQLGISRQRVHAKKYHLLSKGVELPSLNDDQRVQQIDATKINAAIGDFIKAIK